MYLRNSVHNDNKQLTKRNGRHSSRHSERKLLKPQSIYFQCTKHISLSDSKGILHIGHIVGPLLPYESILGKMLCRHIPELLSHFMRRCQHTLEKDLNHR